MLNEGNQPFVSAQKGEVRQWNLMDRSSSAG